MIDKINTNKAPQAIGPYSQGIIYNRTIYTSGQISIDPNTNEFINGTIEEQTEIVVNNIKSILIAGGSSLANVLKVNIYLKNINDFENVNKIYAQYFTTCPSRSTIEVTNLPKGALIEIDCIAHK